MSDEFDKKLDDELIDESESYPVMPLRNTVLFPQQVIPIYIGREKSLKLINDLPSKTKHVVVVAQEDGSIEDPQPSDMYSYGTLAVVLKVFDMPDNSKSAIVQGIDRVKILDYKEKDPYYRAVVQRVSNKSSKDSVKLDALANNLRQVFSELIQIAPNLSEEHTGIAIKSGDELERVLKKVCKNDPPFYRMDLLSAEISKLALNCFLTVKISYANSIGDLALKAGADPSKILEAVGGDSRIGPKNLKYGFGYGGPCFPRDNNALLHYADIIGASTPLNKAADDINKKHYNFIFEDFVSKNEKNVTIIFDGIGNMKNLDGDKVKVFEGVAYKPGTSILDESQQLKFAVDLAKNNFHVIINDIDEVTSQLKAEYSDLFHYENKDS